MQRSFVSLVVFFLLLSPLRAAETSPEISDEIKQVIAAQVVAWNAGDHEGFMRGYLKSDDIRFLSGNDITRGWSTVLARYQKRYPDKAAMGTLTLGDLEFTTLGPETVLVVGRWKVDTKKQKSQQGVTTLIFRLTGDGWRIVHDHTS
jgi:ketosteroid isomerase-like protein